MLLTRDEICQDPHFEALTDAILERDQPRTTDLFFKMVARHGHSVGEALSVVTAAEAPFVQVPSHINVRDGQITLINNDPHDSRPAHLGEPDGLRAGGLSPAAAAAKCLVHPGGSRYLEPVARPVSRPLRHDEGPGCAAEPPRSRWCGNADQEPIVTGGSVDERLHEHMIATMSGDVKRSYGLYLGLAADDQMRPRLRDQHLFLGVIDLQDTIIGRKARNTGHKALRARATTDLAKFIGWEQAHGVFYIGVPDMAVGPLYYSIYDAACVTVGRRLRGCRQAPQAGE